MPTNLIEWKDFQKKFGNDNKQLEQTINLQFTLKQAEKLEEVLFDHRDEGPIHEGWVSPELEEIRTIVKFAVEKVKAGL